MTAEDFTALCAVLGLTEPGKRTKKARDGAGAGEQDEEDEEFRDVSSRLPGQLSFKDFHSRLCGYFRVRSARTGTGDCAWRLPLTEDTELVERQIRLRWPRARRRKRVSFDLKRDQTGPGQLPTGDHETGTVQDDMFTCYGVFICLLPKVFKTLLRYSCTNFFLFHYLTLYNNLPLPTAWRYIIVGEVSKGEEVLHAILVTSTRFPLSFFSPFGNMYHSPLSFVSCCHF